MNTSQEIFNKLEAFLAEQENTDDIQMYAELVKATHALLDIDFNMLDYQIGYILRLSYCLAFRRKEVRDHL